MPSYEPRGWKAKRQQTLADQYPELAWASPDQVLQVDTVRTSRGELPSRFTQDMVSAANHFSQTPEQRRQRAIDTAISEFGRFSSVINQADRIRQMPVVRDVDLPASANAAGFADLRGVEDRGQRSGVNLNPMSGALEALGDVGGPVIDQLARPGGAYRGSISALENAPVWQAPVAAVEGAVEGFRNPSDFKAIDSSLAREFSDEDVIGALSPRDIAAGVIDIGLDPVDLVTGGLVATDAARAVRGGLRRLGDDAAETAIRAAEGPLEASTRGVLDLAPPKIPGARIAGGAVSGQPLSGAIRNADDVLATTQSEAARRYAQAQKAADAPVAGGVVDALEQASAAVRTDPQGAASRLADRVPGLRQIRNWDRPGLEMERNILEGHIAKRGVESSLLTEQGTKRVDAVRAIDDTFGEGASSGGRILDGARVDVDNLHRFKGQEYPGTGTVFDAMQRPYAYNLTPEQTAAIRAWSDTDDAMRVLLNEQYGGDVGKFVPERGGIYVQNINRSEARQAQLEELARSEARTITGSGTSKTRVYESGFDRWKNNIERGLEPRRVFVPETDLRVLGYTSDLSKAHAAGDLTFRAAVGGKTISEVKEEVAPALVKLRETLRGDIDSLRGRVQRAEQAFRTDSRLSSRYETMSEQAMRRGDPIAERLDEIAGQYGPEFSYLSGQLRELDARADALAQMSAQVGGRADYARQGLESLREDLAETMDRYREIKRAYDAVDPQDYVQVKSMPGKYFPTRQAAQLEELSRPAKDNLLTRTLEGWRSQVLAGDVGPLTGIQGIILAASGRAGVTKAVAGSLADAAKSGDLFNAFRDDAMQAFLKDNADVVREFAFSTGRNVGGRLPAEIGQGGLLTKIPGFTTVNEAMFNVVTRRQIEMFKRVRDDLIKAGYSHDEAVAAAGDLSSKVVPMMTPARLGQSAAKAQEQRFLPTSLGFIRQPIALTEEAFTGLGKLASGQSLTPREKLATSIYTQFIGNLLAVSVTSAAINAIAQGADPTDAIRDALNSDSRAFLALSAGDKRIPLASPFRAPLRVGIGKLRDTLNLAVEPLTGRDISSSAGDSVVNYATSRIGPPARAIQGAANELTAAPWERNYQGDSDILRLLSAGSILAGGAAPIPVVGIGEEAKRQFDEGAFDPGAIAATALAETASLNLVPAEDRRILDTKAQQAFGASFNALDRQQRRMVLLANPELTDEAKDDVRERMESSGYKDAAERSWSQLAPEFSVSEDSYQDYRDRMRRELEGEGLERTTVEQLLRTDPLVVAYNDLRRGYEYEWIAENAEDLAIEAYDFGLIPDNSSIRAILGFAR